MSQPDPKIELSDLLKNYRQEIREKIMEIKYRDHNPDVKCELHGCETCKICNELLSKI